MQSKHNTFGYQVSYMFRPNMVITRLATRKKRKIYTQLDLDSDLSFSSCGQRDNYHCHRNMQLI
jgi:hypothetical protein